MIENRLKNTIFLYFGIFFPIWLIFLINYYVFNNYFNSFGISPRTLNFSQLFSIFFSWSLHANYSHIINNSISIVSLLFFVSFFEKRPFLIISTLIFLSGILTWLLGTSNSIHIGASGLVFAIFGYILSSAVFGRNLLYFIPIALSIFLFGSNYYFGFLGGLVPQQNISFAAHFGGLISGFILGYSFNKSMK